MLTLGAKCDKHEIVDLRAQLADWRHKTECETSDSALEMLNAQENQLLAYREALAVIAGMTGYAADPAKDPGHLARCVLAQYGRQDRSKCHGGSRGERCLDYHASHERNRCGAPDGECEHGIVRSLCVNCWHDSKSNGANDGK